VPMTPQVPMTSQVPMTPQVPMTAIEVKPPTPAVVSGSGTIGGAMATVSTITKPEPNIFQLFWQWLTLNFL